MVVKLTQEYKLLSLVSFLARYITVILGANGFVLLLLSIKLLHGGVMLYEYYPVKCLHFDSIPNHRNFVK